LYSIERLKHYTATDPKDFQRYMVLTNYNMHIELLKEIYSEKAGFKVLESSGACQMNTIHISNTET
jgi:AMP nucleosidase